MASSYRNSLGIVLVLSLNLLPLQAGYSQDNEGGDDKVIPGWRYEFQRKYELFRDYGYDWRLSSAFALNSEDGLILAGGPILYHFGFRTFPFISRMDLVGAVAIPTFRFKIAYTAFWPRISERISIDLVAHASELEIRNFYGFGNDNPRDEELESDGFYRASSRELLAQPSVRYNIAPGVSAGLSAGVKDLKLRESDDPRFLSESNFPEFGDNRTLGSLGLSFVLDTRDHPAAPHSGVFLAGSARNFLEVFGSEAPFQKYVGEVRLYLGDTLVTDVMLAFRLHGQILDGPFPFHEAAFLGGAGSLRGFTFQRFAGDAAAFGSAELRFSVGRYMIIIPTEIGLFGLFDAGRVWVERASPGGLHTNWGGGIWAAPVSRDFLLSLAVASSVEGLFVAGGAGFGF